MHRVTPLLIAMVACFALLWPVRNILRELFFPENAYFTATTATDLPERFRRYVPEDATAIRLRTYQSAWWVTVESHCSESEAAGWAESIDHSLDSKGAVPELPDHSLPAHQLGFFPVANDQQRFVWHSGSHGRVSNVIYDRETETLYFLQSRI
ncbi:hypothetical protein K227x_64490 [Rubripirellula lacrimiformis]|uniref:Uncharacterized protein n=1 Tax=Rubripirellula lacrimiformis TaxID=1930273 RepID=A0A517NLQ6_9BACT|nr:hypothetical protein [Rubripirellula lacrimiformis]QDT08019.1 hypothetical protein K227x_64490 [Rubripirellula lacrimiformis]